MRELPELSLVQYAGKCKGIYQTLPIDWVVVQKPTGPMRIGLLDHKENATLRFIRVLDPDLREAIRKKCEVLREEQGKPKISLLTVGPPDPRIIKAYLKGERFRKRPTVSKASGIVMPDGTPAKRTRKKKDILSDE